MTRPKRMNHFAADTNNDKSIWSSAAISRRAHIRPCRRRVPTARPPEDQLMSSRPPSRYKRNTRGKKSQRGNATSPDIADSRCAKSWQRRRRRQRRYSQPSAAIRYARRYRRAIAAISNDCIFCLSTLTAVLALYHLGDSASASSGLQPRDC